MEEIYSLVKHGGGGFSFNDVWHMPVFFRRYFIDMIIKENDAQRARQEDAMRSASRK
jgi:hypothetical protein